MYKRIADISYIRIAVAIVAALALLMPLEAASQINPVSRFSTSSTSGNYTGNGYNNIPDTNSDTTIAVEGPKFGISDYFRALTHKDTMNITPMFIGSLFLPGSAQIYNRQYWKLPIIYGGIAAFTTGAIVGKKNIRPYMVGGAVATWYLSVLDGVISYKSYQNPLPARASILASPIPGLGQAWNGDYWKIPLYYGGFAISGYCWVMNQKQYRKYKQMHIDTYESGETSRNGLSLDDMVWYRDRFRRLRDYSIICTALIYVLNIIDANVFSHLSNFDISDDLSLNVQPGVIEPVSIPGKAKMGSLQDFYSQNLGVRLNFNF